MVDVQWTALAPWEDQTPSPRPLAEDLLARERVLTVDAQRMSLEIDTAVGTAPEAQSSGTPSSADTMRSADTPSSTTDDDLIPLDDDEDDDSEMKEEPEPTSPADHGLDAAMQDEATSPISPAEHNPTTTGAARRPRGRPRRTMSSPVVKVAHPRSKTGCMTCRKRKKKCDERRPECHNCEKNNFVCEGYQERVSFESRRRSRPQTSNILCRVPRMPKSPLAVIPGLEDRLDRVFWDHFHSRVSTVLTLHDEEESNPFVKLVSPMAVDHAGLMHSMLALSGSHLSRCVSNEQYQSGKDRHMDQAMTLLREDVVRLNAAGSDADEPLVACIIMQCLIPITDGSTTGVHRVHLEAARQLIKPRPGNDFLNFAFEFYRYHDMSSTMTSLERPHAKFEELLDDDDEAVATPASATAPTPTTPIAAPHPYFPGMPNAAAPGAGVMIGVCDGLIEHITRISTIRQRIRGRKQQGLTPVVEYRSIRDGSVLGRRLLDWRSGHTTRSPKWVLAELYRETALVYLHRSLRASRPDPDLGGRVDRGLAYLRALPPDHPAQSVVLLPTFVLACAAFDAAQRGHINDAFARLQAYSGLGNIERAREVVTEVWRMMDASDERSWDWETIMADMNYHILVT